MLGTTRPYVTEVVVGYCILTHRIIVPYDPLNHNPLEKVGVAIYPDG